MAAPVRGTQSFVGVMSQVWRRRSLTAMEVGWRWLAGGPILAAAYLAWRGHADVFLAELHGVQKLTFFKPLLGLQGLEQAARVVAADVAPALHWLVPCGVVLWCAVAGLGRSLVMRRLQPGMRMRPVTVALLSGLRGGLLTASWLLWVWLVGQSVRIAIVQRAAEGSEPSVVLLAAMVICASLGVYVLWGVVSWPLYLATGMAALLGNGPLGSLAAAVRSPARTKLIEVNLVMNIVRICLIVLLMVFCACPLPFASQENGAFLGWWWTGMVLLYLAASDYFHVVRVAAYLSLHRSLTGEAG